MKTITLPRLSQDQRDRMPSEYSIGVFMQDADEDLEIFLHGIVGDDYTGTDSQTVSAALAKQRGKPVTVRVNSPGGLAYDGLAIYNALASHTGTTTAIIEGTAGSAASLIVLGCDTVRAYPSAQYQPHYSMTLAYGHQADLRDALTMLEKLDAELEQIYAERSGQSLEKVKADLLGPEGDGVQMNAREALDAGYIHELIDIPKRAAAASRPAATFKPYNARLRLLKLSVDSELN
jgi:ATP-dependent Clp protease protease subunit